MNSVPTPSRSERFSARAPLAAIGIRLRQLHLFGPVSAQVHMAQKQVKHTPIPKLSEAFIAILAGAHGLVAINKRLRADPSLHAAFGRQACAEQSVVQETLDAWTEPNVAQMHQAMDLIYRRHGRGYGHDDTRSLQLWDADMTGMPCGKKAAFASTGYFAKPRNRRGRQLGRVLATRYDAVVVERLFAGTTPLTTALHPLVLAAEKTLELDDEPRRRTLWRLEAGGGRVEAVNWLLGRGSPVHGQDDSGTRAQNLAAQVTAGVDDPRIPERHVGGVRGGATPYSHPSRRVAVRGRKRNGQWGVGVLLSTLTPPEVIALTRQPVERVNDPTAVLLASVYFYDQRGGGVETAIKGDKPGVGMTKRHKKRVAAQQMLTQLHALAHNTMVWVRQWLTPDVPTLRRWGIMRLVRDVLHVNGRLTFAHGHGVSHIMLNAADPRATRLVTALCAWLESDHLAVTLGKT